MFWNGILVCEDSRGPRAVVGMEQAGRADVEKEQSLSVIQPLGGSQGQAVLPAPHIQLERPAADPGLMEEFLDIVEGIGVDDAAQGLVGKDFCLLETDDRLKMGGKTVVVEEVLDDCLIGWQIVWTSRSRYTAVVFGKH